VATDICSNDIYSDINWVYNDFNNGSADNLRSSDSKRRIATSRDATNNSSEAGTRNGNGTENRPVDKRIVSSTKICSHRPLSVNVAGATSGSSTCQNLSMSPSMETVNETGNDCRGPVSSTGTGPIKIQPKTELKADGNASSTEILRPSIIDAKTSLPNNKSTGDDTWNDGSANAKLEYLSLMSAANVLVGNSFVIVGNTHACTTNAGSDENRGCTVHSTRPCTFITSTPDKPLIGAVQRDRLRPNLSAPAAVIALICDAQSTSARMVCQEPDRSRTWTRAVPNITAGDCCGDGRCTDAQHDAGADAGSGVSCLSCRSPAGTWSR